ncbi:FRG domain-containing protein [Thiocapsa roseopersicina]|uniref:FRG domain-containing protein n=1 Tax=Thiocapsa roseopersicina TaxID=1058 RepID=A0A1H2S2K3_THIRO|nr:FRG domain-containing protein [Thiocapsa roseopersicina]SDW25740.1 FRG domain-containing protein [Thiocapsa roseopersicina]
MINEQTVKSVAELIDCLNSLPNHYVYRGHANAQWKLESSLERVIGKDWSGESANKFEEFSLTEFQSKFHLYDHENIQPFSKLAWLSIMQHYGVPTRLLDFTASPYVALYFALESYNPQLKWDFAVYALDYSAILDRSIQHIASKDAAFQQTRTTIHQNQDAIFDAVVDRFSYDIAWIAEPQLLNTRLDRQAGSFLLSGNRELQIEGVLEGEIYRGVQMTKLCIPSSLYEGVFVLLRKMNITSKSLYGDLDGLARSIRMSMQVYSV